MKSEKHKRMIEMYESMGVELSDRFHKRIKEIAMGKIDLNRCRNNLLLNRFICTEVLRLDTDHLNFLSYEMCKAVLREVQNNWEIKDKQTFAGWVAEISRERVMKLYELSTTNSFIAISLGYIYIEPYDWVIAAGLVRGWVP